MCESVGILCVCVCVCRGDHRQWCGLGVFVSTRVDQVCCFEVKISSMDAVCADMVGVRLCTQVLASSVKERNL